MRCGGLRRFFSYVCVGATGTGVQYAVLVALVSTHVLGAVAASCLGAIAGAIVNYVLNVRFTFRSTGPHRTTAPRFFTVAAAGVAFTSGFMFALTHWLHVPWLPAQCVTTACVLAMTYTASSTWAFRVQRA